MQILFTALSAPIDPEAATQAYLALVDRAASARSDAYFEGGYWILLWDSLILAGVGSSIPDPLRKYSFSTTLRGETASNARWNGRQKQGRNRAVECPESVANQPPIVLSCRGGSA